MQVALKSFPGHKGRPGKHGGSVPRGAASVSQPSKESEQALTEALLMFSAFGKQGDDLKYANTYDATRKEGRLFSERISLPDDVTVGKMKQCYLNAFTNMVPGKYYYTEGYAWVEGLPIPIQHAWLTTEDGKVIDPTWNDSRPTAYYGIQYNYNFVAEIAMDTGYPGVLGNDFYNPRDIIINGFPEGAIHKPGTEQKSFPGHKGRPGKRGGSLPRGDSSSVTEEAKLSRNIHHLDPSSYKFRALLYTILGKAVNSVDEIDPYSDVGLLAQYNAVKRMYEEFLADPEAFAKKDTSGFSNIIYDSRNYGFSVLDIPDDESPDRPKYPDYPPYEDRDKPEVAAAWELARQNYYRDRTIAPEQIKQVLDALEPLAKKREAYLHSALAMPSVDTFILGMQDFGIDVLGENAYDMYGKGLTDKFQNALGNIFPSLDGSWDKRVFLEIARKELTTDMFEEFDNYAKTLPENQRKNYESWLYAVSKEFEDTQEFEVYKELCGGMSTEKSKKLFGIDPGWSGSGNDFVEVPDTLWHATTDAAGIEANGIRSRRELGGRISEVGLGGGVDNAISFGSDENVIKNIERALHEGHLIASGKVTLRQMLELARDGGGGVGHNWVGKLFANIDPHFEVKENHDPFVDGMPARLQNMLDVAEGRKPGGGSDYNSQEGIAFEFYTHEYAIARQYAGGFADPLFFGTMRKGLASKDPSQFKSMKYKPRHFAVKGWRMGSLSEFRISGGENVVLQETVDFYDANDIDAILGVKK